MGKKPDRPKKNSTKEFLKKRAPIYLGLTGLFLIFVIPQLTSTDLKGLFPEDLPAEDERLLGIIMSYSGPNEGGLTVLEEVESKIKKRLDDDKIFSDRSSKVLITTQYSSSVSELGFTFESDKGSVHYTWSLDAESGKITGGDAASKNIIDRVNFYD